MPRYIITSSLLDRIGDAIREKTKTSQKYSLRAMPDAIRSIKTGGGSGGDGYLHLTDPVIQVGEVTDGSIQITVSEVISAG